MPALKQPSTDDDDPKKHRETCPVCSTLGVRRDAHQFSVREFTPGGQIVELTITQEDEPLEDQDITWALQHAASLFKQE
jgi:hypothetical protein